MTFLIQDAMKNRTRSIYRNLMFRLLAAALFLSFVLGYATYLNELSQVQTGIANRSQLGLELIKLETQRLLEAKVGNPEAPPVQQAVEFLAANLPQSAKGQFAVLLIQDAQRRELARFLAPDIKQSPVLAEKLLQQGLRYPAKDFEFGDAFKLTDTPDIPVAAVVSDTQGKAIAYVNGVYVLSDEAVADMHRKTLRAVLLTIALILITIALVYPFIKGLVSRLSRLTLQILDANIDTLKTLGSAIAKRDSDTDAHNYRVTVYAVRMAESLGLEHKTIRKLIKGAFLHDVGKIGIRDNILHKPGRLDEVEFSVMQQHVMHGLDIVHRAIWLEDAVEVVGNHHEKFDGSGYPQGLSGEAIPVSARIFAIVDVFDALTSQRPYKQPFSLADSLAILHEGAGSHFDPELVSRFETMAADLYTCFAHQDDAAHTELAKITLQYFQGDLGEMLSDQETVL
jgi:HD-GYP domain-containing protein (c-di-GMP phosphodiesterase class II)